MRTKFTPSTTNQAWKFILAGLATTLVHFIVLSLLFIYLTYDIISSTVVAFSVAVVFSYCLNYWFTYQSTQAHERSAPKFVFSVCVGFTWNVSLMYLLVEYLKQGYIPSFLLVTVIVMINNFFLTKYWVFKT